MFWLIQYYDKGSNMFLEIFTTTSLFKVIQLSYIRSLSSSNFSCMFLLVACTRRSIWWYRRDMQVFLIKVVTVVCIFAETKVLCSTSQCNPICRDRWTRYRRSKSLPQRRLETLTQKAKRRLAFSNYVTTNGGIANMEDKGNM